MDRINQCPFCGGEVVKGQVMGELNADASTEEVKKSWIGLVKNGFFTYNDCGSCGGLYCPEYPEQSVVDICYESMPENMEGVVDIRDRKETQTGYARLVKGICNRRMATGRDMEILEIGADGGLLASEISRQMQIMIARYTAVEPNEKVLKVLRNNLDGIAKIGEVSRDIRTVKGKYDLVIGIHVFDHIRDISGYLAMIKESLLKEKGIVFFVVHDRESLISRVMGKRWPPYCPQHPHLFTRQSVRRLSKRLGFRVLDSGRTWNTFAGTMVRDVYRHLPRAVEKIRIRLPLGNRYYVLEAGE